MARAVITGEPGEVYTNYGPKLVFQFVAELRNTCGVCLAHHMQISSSPWPVPYHRGCRCESRAVFPGKSALPYVDFRDVLGGLDPAQRNAVVGASNLALIESGAASWEDVVTGTRVRDFREVVSRKRLTVAEMTAAGVSSRQAERAYDAVHTAAHELSEGQRKVLAAALSAKGLSPEQLRTAVGQRLAARVGIGGGPSGPSALPATPPTPKGPSPKPTPLSPSPRPRPAAVARPMAPPLSPAAQRAHLEHLGVKPAVVAQVTSPTVPILPGRPIAERIAGYAEGREKVAKLAALGDDYGKAIATRDTKKAEVEAIESRLKGLRGAKRKAVEDELAMASLELSKAQVAANKAQAEARQQAQDILAAPQRNFLGMTEASQERLSEFQRQSVAEAHRWIQRTVHLEGDQRHHREDYHPVKGRAACGESSIDVDSACIPQTVVHEIGHRLDFAVAGCDKSAREFLAHRVGDEIPRRLRDVAEGKFDRDEYGRKDKFGEALGDRAWYAGKEYEGGMTEITAMGLEQMFKDPVGFARRDPEFATFILGLMHGALR